MISLRRVVRIAAIATLTLATLAAPVEAEENPLRIEVRLSERSLDVFLDDERIKAYVVAIGKPDHPTPRGEFKIAHLVWNPRWVPPNSRWARNKKPTPPGHPDNPMKVVKLFFKEPDYYIHGTDADDSLGQEASHGCIRMAQGDVEELGKLAMEHGGRWREERWFRRILRLNREHHVRLSTPVSIVIMKR
ncbi:MAG TPA: L,D-transpeptidase [Thermoanaerobaculia bacterium]|nr:L,D-transpeptidase [Thermoanaerobaculia bacterium]